MQLKKKKLEGVGGGGGGVARAGLPMPFAPLRCCVGRPVASLAHRRTTARLGVTDDHVSTGGDACHSVGIAAAGRASQLQYICDKL